MSAFEELVREVEPLAGYPRPWFVCGGWAIDLFLDEVTREHEDVEVGVLRDDQQALREHLQGWAPFKCARPGAWDPWEIGELLELPVHQVLARPPGSGPTPETWVPQAGDLQFFLNEVEDGVWVSRRDARVTLPLGELAFVSAYGVPAVVPEVQLLYKAKHHLDKDERDFAAAAPRLTGKQRTWLRAALELVHPDDPWLAQLDPAAAAPAPESPTLGGDRSHRPQGRA